MDLPSLGKILDNQRSLTVSCRTKPELSAGGKVFFVFIACFVALVVCSTLVDVMLGSRILESALIRKPYDFNNAILPQENIFSDLPTRDEVDFNPVVDGEEVSVSVQDDVSSTFSRRQQQERTPLLKAARSKPTTVESYISDNTFKPSTAQMVFCYCIQFFLCWSAIRNFKRLMHFDNSPIYQKFQFINGIKMLASLWMVLGK